MVEAAVCALPTCSRRRQRKLRRRTLRLIAKHPEAEAWLEFVCDLPAESQESLLDRVLGGGYKERPTEALCDAIRAAVEEYPAGWWSVHEFADLVAAAKRGVPAETFRTWGWVRTVREAEISLRLCKGPEFVFPLATAKRLLNGSGRALVRVAYSSWRLISIRPSDRSLLEDQRFLELQPWEKEWILGYFEECRAGRKTVYPDPWKLYCVFLELPGRVRKEFLYERCADGWQFAILGDAGAGVLERVAEMRTVEQAGFVRALQVIALDSRRRHGRIAGAPAAVFARIGKAKINRQLWPETQDGINWIGLEFPDLIEDGLLRRPDLLFVLGCRLGIYGKVRTRLLLRELRSMELFRPLPELSGDADTLVALDRLVIAHRELASAVPAFATWDKHFSGEKVLDAVSILDVGRQMMEGLTAMRLRYLIDRVDREVALFGDAHAGLLYAGLPGGGRPLVRFLREYSQGRDVRLQHPANQAWLAKRPDFALSVWMNPLRITLPVSGLGDVTLGPEDDPHEILRLGTYAKTCVAAGAWNSINAVAVLLDVNKRVLFARKADGKFLARQIVGISDSGLLYCHRVYPDKMPEALADLFQLYVEDLAMQLRLPIARGRDRWEDVRISALAGGGWYEDGLWQRYYEKDEG